MTKFVVYYYTIEEYSIEVEAEDEKGAIKKAKECWMDGDEQSEYFDDDATVEVERAP